MYPAYTLPVWLTDEQLLRDEAVLFGLSEARPDEKIASIRLAFAALTAPLEKQIEQHHEAIGELTMRLSADDTQPNNQQLTLSKSGSGSWLVGGCLLGLLLSLLVCAGTYLGTLAFVNAQLALLMASLAGISGCVLTLFVSLTTYRNRVAAISLRQAQLDAVCQQQLADRADWQQQKRLETEQSYQAEATLNQQHAHRDLLIRLFESEFDLARSLRHQVRDRFIDL